jgi:hypothetical protein
MLKSLTIIVLIFLLCLLFASGNKTAYTIIESNTPGILGAILGGIISGISIIFSVMLSLTSNVNNKLNQNSFDNFMMKLKTDIKILLICLALSVLLPYLRITGIPLVIYPSGNLMPGRDVLFTALELTTIVVSISIILEIFNVMLLIFSHHLKIQNNSDDKNTPNA